MTAQTPVSSPQPKAASPEPSPVLRGVVETLLAELKNGAGDRDKRRQVEEWMKSLAEKYPEFSIDNGLREYYLAEADRLKIDFEKTADLTEKLSLGRSIESFLDRAREAGHRAELLARS